LDNMALYFECRCLKAGWEYKKKLTNVVMIFDHVMSVRKLRHRHIITSVSKAIIANVTTTAAVISAIIESLVAMETLKMAVLSTVWIVNVFALCIVLFKSF